MNKCSPRVRQILRRSYELDHAHYAIGIEILPYKLFGVIITAEGGVAGRYRLSLSDMEPEAVVQGAAKLAGLLADSKLGCSFPRSRVCLGIQVGGPVDTDTGLVRHLVNGPDDRGKDKPPPYEWVEFPLGPRLMSVTGWDTAVENDAHAFAAYEQALGVGRHAETFGVVLVRDGVGAGMVIRHQRLSTPMEFGHLRIWPNGRDCDCGMHGCIESQVGNRALTGAIKDLTGRELDGLEAAIDLADGDDHHAAAALTAFRKAGTSLARGLAHLLTLFAPSHLVLYAADGLLSSERGHRAANAFRSAVNTYQTYAFHDCRDCQLVTQPLTADRGAHGAALIALQNCFGVRLPSH
ncbi:ROK family protein [Streptomyces sp. NPDC047082]|uniref:ROK family protein n=1 Tax=Streptomyces sp. NPDC047082 TaxID=3155259 RepID=UPI00340ED785